MYITEKKLLKWALYSNAIYVLLLFLIKPNGINIQKILITSLLLFSVISIIFIFIKNKKLYRELPQVSRVLFSLIILWGCIVIIRGFSLSIQDWVTNFGNVYMALAWVVPFSIILGLKIENWSIVIKAIFFMFKLMMFAFLLIPFHGDLISEWTWLLRPVNFILLIGLYRFRFVYKITIFLIIAISFVVAIKLNQRMEFLYLFLVIGFLFFDKIFIIKIQKRFLKYIIVSFIIVFTLVFTVGYEFVSDTISSVIDFQDSRTFLFTELFEDLSKTNDELYGRGSLGTYFSQFFENTRKYFLFMGSGWPGDVPIRITTEVGYLQMILKGGYVMLVLNVLLYFYAVFVGIFKSKNKFIKRLGYYILVITILSLVSFRPAFTPTFILFWMAIGTVLSKKYRIMNDKEINNLIQF